MNESFVHIESNNNSVYDLLSDNFTFDVPNARWTPSFKSGKWDGKIRLFDKKTKMIYRGILPDIYRLLKDQDVGSVKVTNYEKPADNVDRFDKWLETKKDSLPYPPYDYQIEAARKIIAKERRLILSPTSSGKSYIFYLIIAFLLENNELIEGNLLLVVPSVMLVNQLTEDLENFGLSKKRIHQLRGNKKIEGNHKVAITTWQSVYKESPVFFQQFSGVFVDEVHTATGESIKGIMEKCTKAWYRVGMTGTLKDSKIDELVLRGLFGSVTKTIDHETMIKRKIAAGIRISMTRLSYDKIKDNDNFKIKRTYQEEIDFMISLKNRDNSVCKLISEHPKENILVLFRYKKHGKRMLQRAKELFPDREFLYIDGGVGEKERDEIKKRMDELSQEERGSVLFATYATLSTGVSIKNLDVGILASPVKSFVTVMQTIGRLMRISETKFGAIIYDLWDDFPVKRGKCYCKDHAEYRVSKYEEAGFEIEEFSTNFNGN